MRLQALAAGGALLRRAVKSVPTVPKVLGLAGAIPFIVLAPPVCKHLTHILPAELVDNCALFQVCYGAGIVSFLGAVHWGVAMSSSLSSPVALRIANESFIYSVIPHTYSASAGIEANRECGGKRVTKDGREKEDQ
eukprot:gene13028-13157_t